MSERPAMLRRMALLVVATGAVGGGLLALPPHHDASPAAGARDPGELVEPATLTEGQLDRAVIAIDTLFVVGEELFGYPFRPENDSGIG